MAQDLRLRPLNTPAAVGVRTDRNGGPVEIRDRSGKRSGKVTAIQEIWRIDDEWWRRPVSRLYYRVLLENGRVVTLFQDLTDRSWHAH